MQHKRKKESFACLCLVSLINLIYECSFFFFGKVISILVVFLLSIKFILPIVKAKPRVVLVSTDEEVTCCDGIVDWQTCVKSNGIRICRKLGAFQQKCSAFWVLEKCMNSLSYDPWRGFFDVYFISISNCLTKMTSSHPTML